MLFRIRCGRYYRQIFKKSKVKDVYGLNIYFRNAHKDSLMFPITHMINLSLRLDCKYSKFMKKQQQSITSSSLQQGTSREKGTEPLL